MWPWSLSVCHSTHQSLTKQEATRSGGADPKPDEAKGQSVGLIPGPLLERIQGMGLSPYSLSLGGGQYYTHFMEEVIIEARMRKLRVRALC